MGHIRITKGLDIPITGKPLGEIQPLAAKGFNQHSHFIGLDLTPFSEIKFKLLAKIDESVRIGHPLLEAKDMPGVMFASPASGVIREIRRGLKRTLNTIVIEVIQPEEIYPFEPLDIHSASREQILDKLKESGLFPYIRKRPLNLLANPEQTPRAIFVKAISSAPFAVPPELLVKNKENEFQEGLNALAKLTDGKVHLIYHHQSSCRVFIEALNVEKHTAEGPHPISNPSIHIQAIEPIRGPDDVIWTIDTPSVIKIGHFLMTGQCNMEKIVSIAGPGVLSGKTGYFKTREGCPILDLIALRLPNVPLRLISGDVLTGKKVDSADFLGFYHDIFSVVPENNQREFLHFLRLGTNKFTASKAYFSGWLPSLRKEYDFTTNQHGERRAFVTSAPYEKVMPLRIPVMELVKAVMAEDFELAETLGLLEVDSEDFALPAFVDPSKIEMVEIIRDGLRRYAKELEG